jgi:hypothetical protein
MQRTFGGLVVARLPLEPMARIVAPAHLRRGKRTTNLPAEFAVTEVRAAPVATTTRSLALNPRPLTASGLTLITVSVARPMGASR